jgi:hypothetical protein
MQPNQISLFLFLKKKHGPLKYNQTPLKLGPQKAQIKTKIQKPEKEINMKYDQTQKRKKNKNVTFLVLQYPKFVPLQSCHQHGCYV